MHVLAAAKPVVRPWIVLHCMLGTALNLQNLYQKPVLPHLCPFTAAIECNLLVGSSSPKLIRLASYQLCISFLIPSHLISSHVHRQ